MYNIAPSLSNDFFTKRSPRDRFRGFVSSARNFSKCSEQMWHWLSLSKFAFLIRTTHSLKSGLFFKGSRWNLFLFWNLWAFCLNNQPQHIRPFCSWCCVLEICAIWPMYAMTSCYASKPSTWLPKWRTLKLSCHGTFCNYSQFIR